MYVIDGATFTFVKRLDMPQADVDDLADETERLSGGIAAGACPAVVRPDGAQPERQAAVRRQLRHRLVPIAWGRR